MKDKEKKSIVEIVGKNLLLISCVFAAIFLVINIIPRTVLKSDTYKNSIIVANSVKTIFNDMVNDIERLLNQADAIVNSSSLSRTQIAPLLSNTLDDNPIFKSLEVINKDGQVVYAYPENTLGMDRSGEKIVAACKVSKDFCWSNVLTYFVNGDASVCVAKKYDPYVYLAYIDLQHFSDASLAVLKDFNDKYDISVMDSHGIYITNSKTELIHQRAQNDEFEQVKQAVDQNRNYFESIDRRSLVSVAYVKSIDWYIALYADKFEVYSPINSINMTLAAATLFMVVLLWLFYRKTISISKNIQSFTKGISQYSIGQTMLELPDGYFQELDAMKENFITMNSRLKLANDELHHFAYSDFLTGLHNRRAALDFIAEKISQEHPFVLCYFDMDRFKDINDKLGHNIGDLFLQVIAGRLKETVRNPDCLFRVGGDEFIYILPEAEREVINEQIDCIWTGVQKPYDYEQQSYYFSLSIGVSRYPEDADNVDDLLRFADIAMYKAKVSGTGVKFYDREIHEQFLRRLEIKTQLRNSAFFNEVSFVIQPQYEMRTKAVIGFEMFIRWKNHKLGNIPPDEFIPIAESCYAINDITLWIVDQAIEILKLLDEKNGGELKVAINISVLDLLKQDFVETIENKVKAAGIKPFRIELELTEGVMIENYDKIKSEIEKLSAIGFKLALDDFGRGYSSLMHLNQLHFNTLKVDKAFLDSATNDDRSRKLLKSIVDLTKMLHIDVIVEGVETEEQQDLLIDMEAYAAQGYLLSKPFGKDKLIPFLEK